MIGSSRPPFCCLNGKLHKNTYVKRDNFQDVRCHATASGVNNFSLIFFLNHFFLLNHFLSCSFSLESCLLFLALLFFSIFLSLIALLFFLLCNKFSFPFVLPPLSRIV